MTTAVTGVAHDPHHEPAEDALIELDVLRDPGGTVASRDDLLLVLPADGSASPRDGGPSGRTDAGPESGARLAAASVALLSPAVPARGRRASPSPEASVNDSTTKEAIRILNEIMEYELAGVVLYTHYSLMITGPNRMPLVDFMKAQANESLTHAQQAGEILTGLDGHPSLDIAKVDESHKHSIRAILEESKAHEESALALYKELLKVVADESIYLEEYARGMIGQEEMHSLELHKMLRDYTD